MHVPDEDEDIDEDKEKSPKDVDKLVNNLANLFQQRPLRPMTDGVWQRSSGPHKRCVCADEWVVMVMIMVFAHQGHFDKTDLRLSRAARWSRADAFFRRCY